MIRRAAAAAAAATLLAVLSAGAAQAAPARAFECPATLPEAMRLLKPIPVAGPGKSAGAYPTDVQLYSTAGRTVFGLTPKRLWTRPIDNMFGKGFLFMAEVPVSFEVANAALLRGVGKSACGFAEPRHCKFLRPKVGDHVVLQYVEWLSTGVVQIACEYQEDDLAGFGARKPPVKPAPKPVKPHGGHG